MRCDCLYMPFTGYSRMSLPFSLPKRIHFRESIYTKMVTIIQQLLEKPLTLLSFILFTLILYKWLLPRPFSRKKLPPSPPKLPIIGNLHQLGSQPHRALRSMSEQYGELMLVQLGSWPYLIVSSAGAAREIMVTNDVIFANRPLLKKGKKLLYNFKDVASAPYGEAWKQMKSICVLRLLSTKKVRSFRGVREEETALLMEKIRGFSKSSPVNLSKMFMDFMTDMICRVAFQRKYSEEEDGINFNELIKEHMNLIGQFNVGDLIPWLAWIDHLNGWEANVNKVSEEFDQFLEKVVQQHEDRLDACRVEDGDNDEKATDFVDVLLNVQKHNKAQFPIDRDRIKAIILDMFSGGIDTNSVLLEWAMTELLRHPRIMQETQKEVRGITGENLDVNEEDLEKMKYLKAVIKEILRLHPSAPLLAPRESTQDVKINGYDIPAGTAVIINAWAIHRDPAYWDEPEKFKPQRFLNYPTDFRGQDLQFIPFGAGRRICPGISFAVASTELVLANLMHKFDWSLPDGAEGETLDMSECFGLTVHRKTPLLAVATAYNCSN